MSRRSVVTFQPSAADWVRSDSARIEKGLGAEPGRGARNRPAMPAGAGREGNFPAPERGERQRMRVLR
jgi:hypothetical protein